MSLYFGTDGIRGIANVEVTPELAFRTGNALAQMGAKKIIIGRDTRISGDLLSIALASGAMAAGCNAVYLNIVPTAGIAYLTCHLKADFGIVISASHNPAEFNGIKIFSSDGTKLSEKDENRIEGYLSNALLLSNEKIGNFSFQPEHVEIYEKHLLGSLDCDLKKLKIVIDCANGAAWQIAPKVFRMAGADVIATGCENAGERINEECGSLFAEKTAKLVIDENADMGFCFDGDADRVIAVDHNGKIVDGDKILYLLAGVYKEKGILKNDLVIGTSHTNMAIQKELKAKNIQLLRANIGDKYVSEMMIKEGAVLGGEQSGHTIIRHLATTGDGILTALQVAQAARSTPLAGLSDVKLFPQVNINVVVHDKMQVINNERLWECVNEYSQRLKGKGRVLVRASGTESKIRIVTECQNKALGEEIAEKLKEIVQQI